MRTTRRIVGYHSGMDCLCPWCKKALKPTTITEGPLSVPALACPACGGQLFNRQDLKEIEDTVVLRMFQKPTAIPTSRTQLKPVACPRCPDHPAMAKASNQRHAEVIMDVCGTCSSVWLDKGELARMREEGFFSTIAWCLMWMKGD